MTRTLYDTHIARVRLRVLFEWRDAWWGAYLAPNVRQWRLYVCFVPWLPLLLEWPRRRLQPLRRQGQETERER